MANVEPTADEYEVAEYCGRLTCGKAIVQTAGRGRRREFCSEICRRAADREYKRAKAMVEHFERYLEKSRHEVAAYGRRAEADGQGLSRQEEADKTRVAAVAVARAQAVVEFALDPENRFLSELRDLVEAVAPLVDSGVERASA